VDDEISAGRVKAHKALKAIREVNAFPPAFLRGFS
jgi:hypothetical protein